MIFFNQTGINSFKYFKAWKISDNEIKTLNKIKKLVENQIEVHK